MEIGHWPKELGHRAGWPTRPANPTRPCEHGPLKSVAEWYNKGPVTVRTYPAQNTTCTQQILELSI